MKISLIVPAYNEEKLLGASLRHILAASRAFHRQGWETELVVCDNNSTDATGKIAAAAGARVVFEPINQIGRARNRGAVAATGEWLIFIDADSHPCEGLFGEVAEQIQSGRCLGGGSTIRLDEAHLVGQLVTRGWNLLSRAQGWAAGSFIFCQAAAFRAIGGFSLELFASEEIDLSARLKRLAREQSRRFVILHRHPITTSARKLHLYSRREHFRFLRRAILRPARTIRHRAECPTWYDGRR
ncbi:MAG: glycosyltransferase [Verrucomicrobiota bacterium]